MELPKIKASDIPDWVYAQGCRILRYSVKKYFEQPGVREAYEKWLQTEEGKLAAMTREERMQYEREKQMAATSACCG